MPSSDSRKEGDSANDSSWEIDRDRDRERERDKGGRPKGPSKTKDLSHVPCKFFKVGSCTAGSSCPFSHTVLEPGQQKEVCAWFVKGNCKFGHKCALAHILPGQPMSMDRKNKKAAQLAANASNAGAGGREGRSGRSHKSGSHGGSSGSQPRNPLLSGSTAPTRAVGQHRSAIPMPLKATLSPSTPAPPVKDTEFVSFDSLDESDKLPSAPAQGKSTRPQSPSDAAQEPASDATQEKLAKAEGSPTSEDAAAPSPANITPTASTRIGNGQHGSPSAVDFGPIGSPSRTSPTAARTARINGFSPGTSPQTAGLSHPPFSAPNAAVTFAIPQRDPDDPSRVLKNRSGLSASLGAMTWSTERRASGMTAHGVAAEVVVEDEDLEEFLPSSLTDLLTPEERSRRASRTNSARPAMLNADSDTAGGQRPSVEGHHHRYSRSVPAPSLLQDIRSIWADAGETSSGAGLGSLTGTGGLGNGTPSSFTSNSGLSGRPSGEDMLLPSNASAAFLPGLHHHYLNATTQQRSSLLSGMTPKHSSSSVGNSAYSSAYGSSHTTNSLAPSLANTLGSRTALDNPSLDAYPSSSFHHQSGRPIHSGVDGFGLEGDDRQSAISPSVRALQAHAPGQSLPQGLAAGYSRIHALPPPVIASPSTPGAFSHLGSFSPGTKAFGHAHNTSGEWHSMSPSAGNSLDQVPMSQNYAPPPSNNNGSLGGLENMFSRLSYSAAAARGGAVGNTTPRNASGRAFTQGLSSPLARPVLTGDDDELFSMDG